MLRRLLWRQGLGTRFHLRELSRKVKKVVVNLVRLPLKGKMLRKVPVVKAKLLKYIPCGKVKVYCLMAGMGLSAEVASSVSECREDAWDFATV